MKLFQMLFNFLSIKYILLNLIFRTKALVLVIIKTENHHNLNVKAQVKDGKSEAVIMIG